MIFQLTNAIDEDLGAVEIKSIEDLKAIQFDIKNNPKNDELIIDFKNNSIMIYDYWIE